jgi:hypothetical protein
VNRENKTIIKALNMYGRVPEQWELLEEIERLNNRIDKAIEYIENHWIEYSDFQYVDNDDELNIDCESIKELLDILKGSDINE